MQQNHITAKIASGVRSAAAKKSPKLALVRELERGEPWGEAHNDLIEALALDTFALRNEINSGDHDFEVPCNLRIAAYEFINAAQTCSIHDASASIDCAARRLRYALDWLNVGSCFRTNIDALLVIAEPLSKAVEWRAARIPQVPPATPKRRGSFEIHSPAEWDYSKADLPSAVIE